MQFSEGRIRAMPRLRRVWSEVLAGYRLIAYWTPPVWYGLWEHQRTSLDPAPLWARVIGSLSFVLAIVCTVRLEQKGIEEGE